MKDKDIDFFQGIINAMLRYITASEIENEEIKQKFKVVYINPESKNEPCVNKQN